ncbi:class I SAM-dependent methyltransferase [Burkholderia ubonensis]|uniref:class I SAM-dependent methyltransferase n=1 Tax=Burkholderia ubonensis TaxID=101571 RepID=UPI00358DE2C8
MASKADIAYHYDVDNSLYELFLDKRYRAYSCAIWDGVSTLEEAQHQKLARLSRFAGMSSGQAVLDIGCGWGGMMQYALADAGAASAVGVTLSEDQHRFVTDLNDPRIDVKLTSWKDYAPSCKFDALVSIGAFEHFASLSDRDAGQHRRVYTEFFQWCRSVSTDHARLGLQTIVTLRMPRNLQEVRDTRYLLERVFPGSALPAISDIQAGVQDAYEIVEARQIGLDYARTLANWRERLVRHRSEIEDRFGAEVYAHYDRYFLAAESSFRAGIVGLVQMSLSPVQKMTVFRR